MIVKGANLSEGPSPYAWSKIEGPRIVRVFNGVHEQCLALVDDMIAVGADAIAIDPDEATGTSRMQVHFGLDPTIDPEIPVVTWELVSNDLTRSLYDHPKALALPALMIRIIKAAVEWIPEGKDADDNEYTADIALEDLETAATAAGLTAGTNPTWAQAIVDASYLIDEMIANREFYSVDQTVLRKNILTSREYVPAVGTAGVGRLWTTAQITGSEAIDPAILVEIGAIDIPTPRTGYLFSWLKKRPHRRTAAGNKIEHIQEWWLEQWDTWRYLPW